MEIEELMKQIEEEERQWPLWKKAQYFIIRRYHSLVNVYHEVRYAFQRAFRGYDDRITWGIDYHLAKFMPIWIDLLKENAYGVSMEFVPDDCFEDGWATDVGWEQAEAIQNETFTKIGDGFRAANKMLNYEGPIDDEYERLKTVVNDGLQLFAKYFFTLKD